MCFRVAALLCKSSALTAFVVSIYARFFLKQKDKGLCYRTPCLKTAKLSKSYKLLES